MHVVWFFTSSTLISIKFGKIKIIEIEPLFLRLLFVILPLALYCSNVIMTWAQDGLQFGMATPLEPSVGALFSGVDIRFFSKMLI